MLQLVFHLTLRWFCLFFLMWLNKDVLSLGSSTGDVLWCCTWSVHQQPSHTISHSTFCISQEAIVKIECMCSVVSVQPAIICKEKMSQHMMFELYITLKLHLTLLRENVNFSTYVLFSDLYTIKLWFQEISWKCLPVAGCTYLGINLQTHSNNCSFDIGPVMSGWHHWRGNWES